MTQEADLNNENNTDSERENIIEAYRTGDYDFTESNDKERSDREMVLALEALYNFHQLELSMYEEYNQINFFVPNHESDFTADEMTEILC